MTNLTNCFPHDPKIAAALKTAVITRKLVLVRNNQYIPISGMASMGGVRTVFGCDGGIRYVLARTDSIFLLD